jgi:hypothetical protein
LVGTGTIIFDCYIHDAGTSGSPTGGYAGMLLKCYIYNCPTGAACASAIDCVFVNSLIASASFVYHCSFYSSTAATTTAIAASGVILNNLIEGWSGVGGKAVANAGDLIVYGYCAFYNNTTPESLGDVYLDLGGDVTLAASAFTNAAGGDFSLATAVAGAIDGAFPSAWYGLAGTTDHDDIGAVQNGAGASAGGLLRHPGMSGGIDG